MAEPIIDDPLTGRSSMTVGSAKVANRFGLELIPIDGVLAKRGVLDSREAVVTEGRIGAFPLSFVDTDVVDVEGVGLAGSPLEIGLAGKLLGIGLAGWADDFWADGPA
jgi:hypothetical protein